MQPELNVIQLNLILIQIHLMKFIFNSIQIQIQLSLD
jgi:hypothetical protein